MMNMGIVYFGLCLAVVLLLSRKMGWGLYNHVPLNAKFWNPLDRTSPRSYSIFVFFFFFGLPLFWACYFFVYADSFKEDWCSQKAYSTRSSDYCKDTEYYINQNDPWGGPNAPFFVDPFDTVP